MRHDASADMLLMRHATVIAVNKSKSQNNTEKQIKPQITRKESHVWRFARDYYLPLREAP
jgi:hypothetical protein